MTPADGDWWGVTTTATTAAAAAPARTPVGKTRNSRRATLPLLSVVAVVALLVSLVSLSLSLSLAATAGTTDREDDRRRAREGGREGETDTCTRIRFVSTETHGAGTRATHDGRASSRLTALPRRLYSADMTAQTRRRRDVKATREISDRPESKTTELPQPALAVTLRAACLDSGSDLAVRDFLFVRSSGAARDLFSLFSTSSSRTDLILGKISLCEEEKRFSCS